VRRRLGLADEDELILWNGGLWSWLDPGTAIRALARLRDRRPRARLVFMGASDAGPAGRATREARTLARDLGLLDGAVIFNDAWVPYAQRGGWLMAADCAISTHLDHLESRFSSRTRLLDCFWARLPVVCTAGDELAARVVREELGAAVPPGDPEVMAGALERVLDTGRAAYADRLARVAADLTWSRVAAPLISWLAADRDPEPLGAGRGLERRPSERLRSTAYVAGARTLAPLHVRPPRAE